MFRFRPIRSTRCLVLVAVAIQAACSSNPPPDTEPRALVQAPHHLAEPAPKPVTAKQPLQPASAAPIRERPDLRLRTLTAQQEARAPSLGHEAADVERTVELLRGLQNGDRLLDRTAWMLATSPDPHLRSGALALALLNTSQDSAVHPLRQLRTRAAVLAAAGNFASAIATAGKARQLAAQSQPAALHEVDVELASYRTEIPFLDPRLQEDLAARGPAVQSAPLATALGLVCREMRFDQVAPLLREPVARLALALAPTSDIALEELFRCLLDAGLYQDALAMLNQERSDSAAQPQISIWMAEVYLAQEQEHLAIDILREAHTTAPDSAALREKLAWHLATSKDRKLRQPTEALALIEPMRQEMLADPLRMHQLAAIYSVNDHFDRAAEVAGLAEQHYRVAGNRNLAARHRSWRLWYSSQREYSEEAEGRFLNDLDMDDGEWHLAVAASFSAEGQLREAAHSLSLALQYRPEDPDVLMRLAVIRQQQGWLPEAVRMFARSLQQRPGWCLPANSLAWLLAAQPTEPWHDPEEALVLAHLAATTAPPERCEPHDALGIAYAALERYDEAIEYTHQALQVARQSNYSDTSRLERRLEQYRQQIPYLERPISATIGHETLPRMFFELGALALSQGRIKAAEKFFQRALEAHPGEPHLLQSIGQAWLKRGYYERAIEPLRAAFAAASDRPETANELAWVLATRPEATPAELKEAESLARKACQLAGNQTPITLDTLAVVFAAQGQLDQAIQAAETAAEGILSMPLREEVQARIDKYRNGERYLPDLAAARRPERSYFSMHLRLGKLLLEEGNAEAAAEYLQAAVQIDPESFAANYHLAQALESQHSVLQAADSYRSALKIHPTFGQAANNLAWLLATGIDASPRYATEAVDMALVAKRSFAEANPTVLDTLGAAYASIGQFPEALNSAQQALELADRAGMDQLATQIQQRLELYQQGKPFRQE